VQSSSSIVFLVLDLAGRGVISFPAGAALIIGANVGTTLTPLLASLEHGRDVQRLALAHALVKLGGALVALLAFPFFSVLLLSGVDRLPLQHTVAVQLAAVHTAFNVLNVAGWLLAGPVLIAVLRWLMPSVEAGTAALPAVVRKMLVNAPDRALAEVEGQLEGLTRLAKAHTDACLDGLEEGRVGAAASALRAFDQLKDGAYELLLTLARSTHGHGGLAGRVRHQLRVVGVCGEVGHLALDLMAHLERGLDVDGFDLPGALSSRVGAVRAEFDALWLRALFPEHRAPLLAASSGARAVFQELEAACFQAAVEADRRESDHLLWLLEAIARLQRLFDALVALEIVSRERVVHEEVGW
jgi:phosphate:Na+ symporter